MFSRSIVVALFCYGVDAIQKHHHHEELVQYRPFTNGRTPWYGSATRPEADFPTSYKVPSYGVDRNI